jgi:REP element-mobilizing transposase RayT
MNIKIKAEMTRKSKTKSPRRQKRQRRPKQLQFQGEGLDKPNPCFGGNLLGPTTNPKRKRPLDSKLPIHLTLRANQSGMRAPNTHVGVNRIATSVARKYHVKLYEYANVGNHIHAVIKIPHAQAWAGFIRELTGRIALYMKLKGRAIKEQRFWKYRPHTRLVQGWQQAFRTAKQYVVLNQLEAEGFISRKETKTLADLKLIFSDS